MGDTVMMDVAAAVDTYIAALRGRQAPVNTVKAYASDLRHFVRAMPADLAQVDAATIRAFLTSADRSGRPATRRRRYATLCSFYRWLVRQDLVAVNPMDRVEAVETITRLPRPLDADSVAAILAAIPPAATRDRALFTLLV